MTTGHSRTSLVRGIGGRLVLLERETIAFEAENIGAANDTIEDC